VKDKAANFRLADSGHAIPPSGPDAEGSIEKEFAIAESCLGVLINRDDDCLHVLIAPLISTQAPGGTEAHRS
jgi:hypothetical protein